MHAFDLALAVAKKPYVYVHRAQNRPVNDSAGRMADLDLALAIDPNSVEALYVKAEQLTRIGKLQDALAIYNRIGDGEVGQFSREKARLLAKLGRRTEAEKLLAELTTKASSATDFNNACWAKATTDMMLESALSDCREALKRQPDSPAYLDSLGMALLKLGKLQEAIAAYDRALAARHFASSLMGRAIAHARAGDSAHAASDRSEAIALDKDVEDRFVEYGLKF
jgi:tetratricopeptide (TPR) repeat protein